VPVVNVTYDWSQEQFGGDTARRGWTVLMSSVEDSGILAERAVGIPRLNDPHPKDSFRRAEQPKTSRKNNNPLLWQVVVDYAQASKSDSSSRSTDNPLDAPAVIEWDFVSSMEEIDRDIDGNPIVNSARQRFDPMPQEEFLYPVLRITRNEATDNAAQRVLYRGAVNSDPFYGVGPGQARLNGIPARRIVSGLLIYWQKTYTIQFRDAPPGEKDASKAWHTRILDQGRFTRVMENVLIAKGIDYKAVLDGEGRSVSDPVLLDGAGQALGMKKKPVWLYFNTRKALPFRVFHLPTGSARR
jgi:hypothetical protein